MSFDEQAIEQVVGSCLQRPPISQCGYRQAEGGHQMAADLAIDQAGDRRLPLVEREAARGEGVDGPRFKIEMLARIGAARPEWLAD